MDVGQKIKKLRSEKGVCQKELAIFLNLSVGTISNYEKGVHSPDLNTLSKIADFFGVTTDYLLDRTDHRFAPDTLSRHLTVDYTVADLVNTTLELSPQKVTSVIDFVSFLQSKESKRINERK